MTMPLGPTPGGPPGQFAQGYQRFGPRELSEQAKAGGRAKVALWVGAACYSIQVFCNAVYLHEFGQEFMRVFDAASTRPRGTTPTITLSSTSQAAQGVAQLVNVGAIVVWIIFLIWFHRAATNARDAGLRARRSPGWAVGGWFIPIGNFWLPYQSASDLFPPDHPGRKVVNRWWTFWLCAQFSTPIVFVAAFASTAAGLAAAVLPAALYVLAAMKARELVDQSLAMTLEAATYFSLVPPGFDPTAPAGAFAGPYGTPMGPAGPAGPAGPSGHGAPGAGQVPPDPWSAS